MRVFVGIPVKNPLLRAIQGWRDNHSDLGVKWVNDENLHITVLTPWETDDVDSARRILRAIRFTPFVMTFHRLTLGSNPKQPNLIWATGRPKPEARLLKRTVQEAFTGEPTTEFLPHVTIAKFNRRRVPTAIQDLDEPVKWQQDADELVLYALTPIKDGQAYTVLERVPAR